MSTRRAVLLIADIGGNTDSTDVRRSAPGHAEAATTRMLDEVVAAARGLELKLVAHVGEVATRTIRRRKKLGGTFAMVGRGLPCALGRKRPPSSEA